MKVLHVISGLAKTAGGTTEAVSKICHVQSKAGLDVTLVAFDYGERPPVLQDAISAGVKYVPMKRLFGSPVLPSLDMMQRLPPLVKASDIVHVHGQWHFPNWYAPYCARRFSKPYVMMPHGALEPERLKISHLKKSMLGVHLDKPALLKSDSIFVTAESERDGVEAYGIRGKSVIIPLGISRAEFPHVAESAKEAVRAKLGIPQGKKLMLYFSRITQFKGVDLLAESWRQMKAFHAEWQLVLAGPDDHHGYLDKAKRYYASLLDDGSYQFVGPVFGADRVALLQTAECFVLPTRNENFSFAIAEAMVSGLPVVTTKGAPWAILEEIDAGRWVDVSIGAIRQGLTEIMSLSDTARADMGLRGRKYVEDFLSWDAIVKRQITAYESIIKGHATKRGRE